MIALNRAGPPVFACKARVLIVDDSAVVRQQLRGQLDRESSIEVIGSVSDWGDGPPGGQSAEADVIVMDIELPSLRGPGRVAGEVGKLKSAVIVLASPTGRGAAAAVEALAAGAVDAVSKPVSSASLDAFGTELTRKIHAARKSHPLQTIPTEEFLAIAGTTGGVKPLVEMLTKLPADAPATLIVQDLPVGFTPALVRYLSTRCAIQVREARQGDAVQQGVALLAPAGKHMLLRRTGSSCFVDLKDGPAGHHERLFLRSVNA